MATGPELAHRFRFEADPGSALKSATQACRREGMMFCAGCRYAAVISA